MTDVSVIILTKDEKLHIGRCLERLAALSPREVFIVDCFSPDGTQRIVEEWKSGGVGDWRSGGVGTAVEFRRRALEKVEEAEFEEVADAEIGESTEVGRKLVVGIFLGGFFAC